MDFTSGMRIRCRLAWRAHWRRSGIVADMIDLLLQAGRGMPRDQYVEIDVSSIELLVRSAY